MATYEVCDASEFVNGSVKEFVVGDDDTKVLLYRENDKFYATSAACTHYGAPLIKGSVNGSRIRCPWHGACYDLKTGGIEDFPCWNQLKKYNVTLKDGKVFVDVSQDIPSPEKPVNKQKIVVIVGGGAAGFTAAQTLREHGFDGRVFIINRENRLPYYRVKLSKQPDMDPAKITLKPSTYFETLRIEILLGKSVSFFDHSKKYVKLTDGAEIPFTDLILATGATPKKLDMPHVPGVHYLRTSDDGQAFTGDANGKNLVIVGSGFIAFEIAASFTRKSKHVTVISKETVPVKRLFGERVGHALLGMHKNAGIEFISDTTAAEFVADKHSGNLCAVKLQNGREIAADACLVAIGADPETNFLKGSGLEIDDAGYVIADEFMRSNLNNVYVAGDIASYPLPLSLTNGTKKRAHFGHWPLAQMTGKIAALNLMEKKTPFNTIPFFWGTMYGTNIRYSGYNSSEVVDNEVVIHGDLPNRKFIAYYLEEESDRVCAVATMGMDPLASHFAELLSNGKQLYRKDIINDQNASWSIQFEA